MQVRVSGREQAKLTLAICVQVKNATLTWCGVTPEQAVFGRGARWFSLILRRKKIHAWAVDGSSWLSSQIQTQECIIGARPTATFSCCFSEEVPVDMRHYVHFCLPHPYPGRNRAD